MATFEDELEHLTASPASGSPSGHNKGTHPTAEPPEHLCVGWGDRKLAKREGLDGVTCTKDRSARVWVVPEYKPVAAYTHFLEGAGNGKGATYRCLSTADNRSICPACARGVRRDLRVIALVAYYETAQANGALPADVKPELSLKFLKLSRANYASVSELIPEDGTLSDIDLVMYNDPSRPIGYLFKALQCRIRQHKLEPQVSAMAQAVMSDPSVLTKRLGKKATAAEMRAALAGPAGAEGADSVDLNDVEDI